MPSAYLKRTSGEGDTLGTLGAEATEPFVVTLDAITQNPIDVLQNSLVNDPYGRGGVPRGQPHPDARFSKAVVDEYILVERTDDPLVVEMLVVYRTPDSAGVGGTFDGWAVSTRVATRTEHIGRSLATRYISDENNAQITRLARLIGPHIYKPTFQLPAGQVGPPQPGTHTVTDPATGKTLQLNGLGYHTPLGPIEGPDDAWDANAPVRVEGYDKLSPVTTITMRRTLRRMSLSTLRWIGTQIGMVNESAWNTFPAATLLLTGFSQDEQYASDDESSTNFRYPITVEISYNPNKWTPIERVETYRAESGEEAEVVRVSNGQIELMQFEVYERTSFSTFFNIMSRLS